MIALPKPHFWSPAVVVFGVPTAMLIVWGRILSVKGPYWLGTNFDPDYQYLLNGLNIAMGFRPGHVDHPGTPLQILMAVFAKITHTLAGSGTLANDIMRRPEMYLKVANWVLLGLIGTALAVAGLTALRVTGSFLAALAMQLVPALSPVLAEHAVCVKPEPLLAALVIGLAALVVRGTSEHRTPRPLSDAAAFGLVVGLASATKITASPLAVVPLVLLPGLVPRLVFVGVTGATAAMTTIPAWPALGTLGAFVKKIATHSGMYGSGEAAVLDGAEYLKGIKLLAMPHYGLVLILLAVGGSVIAAALALSARLREETEADRRARKALVAIIAAQGVAYLLVARHAAGHYLLPAIALTGAVAALEIRVVHHRVGQGAARLVVSGVVALALMALVAQEWDGVVQIRSWMARRRTEQFAVVERLHDAFPGARVVHYYRSSSPAFALHFGNVYAGTRWSDQIHALFPEAQYYNLWDGRLEVYERQEPGGGVVLDRKSLAFEPSVGTAARTVFQGTPLGDVPPTVPANAKLIEHLVLAYSSGTEALYLVR